MGEDFARTGRVSFGGIVKEVNLAYVPEANVDDYVIVHVGFALSVVDEQEAKQVFEYLRQMDELAELEGPSSASPSSDPISPIPHDRSERRPSPPNLAAGPT
jgi:hydrogenase expression/formation protein HypC